MSPDYTPIALTRKLVDKIINVNFLSKHVLGYVSIFFSQNDDPGSEGLYYIFIVQLIVYAQGSHQSLSQLIDATAKREARTMNDNRKHV